MQVGSAEFDERKLAGRALMKEILTLVQLQQEKEVVIATIGGFDLAYQGERFGKDGYRYDTLLQRTDGEYEIDLAVTTTPIGAISRLEHALGGFELERENHRIRLVDAKRRRSSPVSIVCVAVAIAARALSGSDRAPPARVERPFVSCAGALSA